MANFALVEQINENDIITKKVTELYDLLPTSWNNISNFYLLADDEIALKQHGWYIPVKANRDFDTTKYRIKSEIYEYIEMTDSVVESIELLELPPPGPELNPYPNWIILREERDQKMKEFEWRYTRYHRQVRMGITPIDNIVDLDAYMQALADITLYGLENVVWPEYIEPVVDPVVNNTEPNQVDINP